VVVNAMRYVQSVKKTKTESRELADLRFATGAVDACFREPKHPFPPRWVRVLGIDPGFAHLGLVCVDFTSECIRLVHREHFETSTADGTEEHRLWLVAGKLHSVFATYAPDVVAHENVVNAGHQRGETSAAGQRMHEVVGMIRMSCQVFARRPCYAVATSTARKAVLGSVKRGTNVSKGDVKERVRELLGIRGTLSANVSDAGAVCFGGFNLHMEALRENNRG
jgi:Holliday junction resolvasome RuvABC endonuclease subunit